MRKEERGTRKEEGGTRNEERPKGYRDPFSEYFSITASHKEQGMRKEEILV